MSEAPQHAKRRMASGLRGTSLPPPLLPSGLGGSSLKKHKTQHKTKSAWVMEQLTAVTAPTSDPDETDGAVNFVLRYMCNHCQDNLAGSNKDRLKRHLLRCSKFLASTQAGNIAKTFSELAAAIEEYKQENKEVAEVQQDAGTTPSSKSTARAGSGVVEDKGRFAKDLVNLIAGQCLSPLVTSGLGGSSLKKHKTQHKTKSAWVMEQLTAVTAPTSDPDETDGAVNFVLRYMCNHCQDNLAGSNKDRLKRHLLRCSKFLASTQAGNIAKTFSELAAAIEEYKQENKEVAEVQQDAGTTPSSKSTARAGSGVVEDKGRFAKDLVNLIAGQCLSPLVTRNVPVEFVDEVMELEQVFSKRMDYWHHVALYLAAVLDPRYRHKPHNLTIEEVSNAIRVRTATLADVEGVARVCGEEGRTAVFPGVLGPSERRAEARLLRYRKFTVLVAVDPSDNQVVGTVSLTLAHGGGGGGGNGCKG
ncbi:hypothetical protein V8C86DRAFT_3033176 [Haematococcus lacustris]